MQLRDEEKYPITVHPNDQVETVIYIGWQMHRTPYVHLAYRQGDYQSAWIKIKLPVNALFFCEPFVVNGQNFKSLWTLNKHHRIYKFNMDLTRASNLQTIKKIFTLNEKHGAFVQGVDTKPNVVGYSGNHLEGYVFAMLEISATGAGSILQVKSEVSMEFS